MTLATALWLCAILALIILLQCFVIGALLSRARHRRRVLGRHLDGVGLLVESARRVNGH
jgi:hypothetical protein